MKKEYIKPQMEVVAMDFQQSLLSLSNTDSNLPSEDALGVGDETVGDGFWGR